MKARAEGRCLFFTETGICLHRPNELGEPVEDMTYGPFPGNKKAFIKPETVEAAIVKLRVGLRSFYTDLKNDPSMLEASSWIHKLAERWSVEDAPLSVDPAQTPRIEVRGDLEKGEVVGIMVAGVPVAYGSKYLGDCLVPGEIEGQPTGRLCFDFIVAGLSKRLVVDWLLREKIISKTGGVTVCFGDSPGGNDAGLAVYHEEGIPFVSVCDTVSKVPARLMDCHVGNNEVSARAGGEGVHSPFSESTAAPAAHF